MAVVGQNLDDKVRASVASYCRLPPGDLGSLSKLKIYDDDRQIYRVDFDGCDSSFALKVRPILAKKPSDSDPNATRYEYESLRRINAVIVKAGGDLESPIAIDLFDHEGALLTTWCDGRELRKIFYRRAWLWAIFAKKLTLSFGQCGAWLGRFHRASRTVAAAEECFAGRLAAVDRMLAVASKSQGNLLKDRELDGIREAISRYFHASPTADVGLLHGNFTLRNVLKSATGIVPVDFEDSCEGPLAQDAGQMIADIMLSAYRPFIWLSARRESASIFATSYWRHMPRDISRIKGYAYYFLLAGYYEIVSRKSSSAAQRLIAARQAKVYADILRTPGVTIDQLLD